MIYTWGAGRGNPGSEVRRSSRENDTITVENRGFCGYLRARLAEAGPRQGKCLTSPRRVASRCCHRCRFLSTKKDKFNKWLTGEWETHNAGNHRHVWDSTLQIYSTLKTISDPTSAPGWRCSQLREWNFLHLERADFRNSTIYSQGVAASLEQVGRFTIIINTIRPPQTMKWRHGLQSQCKSLQTPAHPAFLPKSRVLIEEFDPLYCSNSLYSSRNALH